MSIASAALAAAKTRIGCPYVWGSNGPNSFDCSGLVYWSYNHVGFHLSDNTADGYGSELVHVGRDELEPGMLIQPHPGHIQIYAGNNRIVEAPRTGLDVREVPVWGWWRGGYFKGSFEPVGGRAAKRYPGHFVQYGDRGHLVREVQAKVGTAVDGVFGPKTRAAVEHYQRAHHLSADGIVGPKTWGKMF